MRSRIGKALVVAISSTGAMASLFLAPVGQPPAGSAPAQSVTAVTTTTAPTELIARASRIRHRLVLDGSTIAILGSSTMTGTVGTTRPWPFLLAAAFEEQGVGVTIDNKALGGSLVTDYLPGGRLHDRITALRANPPSLIILGTRTNEYHAQMPHEEFERQYEALIKLLPSSSRRILVNLAWVKTDQTPTYSQHGYYDAIVRVARRTGDLPILRLDLVVPVSDEMGLYQADNLHMNDAGQQVIFAAMYSAIVEHTR